MKKNLLTLLFVSALLCSASGVAQTLITQTLTTKFPMVFTGSGSFKLNSNITVNSAGVSALEFTNSNVTLDLNGYSIIGPLVCNSTSCNSSSTTYGILMSGSNATIIKNGFISGFYVCAHAVGGQIENLVISSCINGIYATSSTIDHNTVTSSAMGIDAGSSTISNNTLNSNFSFGIYAVDSTVVDNTVTGTTGYGLMIVDGGYYGGNTLIGNTTNFYINSGTPVSNNNNACGYAPC